jgi:hypothetical protein
MQRYLPILLLALFVLSGTGCYYDSEERIYPGSFCDTTGVTWSGTIKPLMQAECAIPGCHVPGSQDPDLTTYAGVRAIALDGSLKKRAIDGVPSFMPTSGKLPNCQLVKLKAWIDAGAPEN